MEYEHLVYDFSNSVKAALKEIAVMTPNVIHGFEIFKALVDLFNFNPATMQYSVMT